jgi:hypothetical protein
MTYEIISVIRFGILLGGSSLGLFVVSFVVVRRYALVVLRWHTFP